MPSYGIILRNQSLNCVMYADDLLVILSSSLEGLQQSLSVCNRMIHLSSTYNKMKKSIKSVK